MSHRHLLAMLLTLLAAEIAHAQVLPGDPVESGIGAAVRNSRAPALFGLSHDSQKYIYVDEPPFSTSRIPPPPKNPKDPWKGLRYNDPIDRHRPQ